MWSRIIKKRIENELCCFENNIGGIGKQLCDFEMTCWALCGVETAQVKLKMLLCGIEVESRFACFYLTGQLELILRKFQLDEVVLVVSKPHVFNLTGQLESTPPVFSTLAATDLPLHSPKHSHDHGGSGRNRHKCHHTRPPTPPGCCPTQTCPARG